MLGLIAVIPAQNFFELDLLPVLTTHDPGVIATPHPGVITTTSCRLNFDLTRRGLLIRRKVVQKLFDLIGVSLIKKVFGPFYAVFEITGLVGDKEIEHSLGGSNGLISRQFSSFIDEASWVL